MQWRAAVGSQRCLAFAAGWQQPELKIDAIGDEARVRHRFMALRIQMDTTLANTVCDPVVVQEAQHGIGIVRVKVQLHGRVGIGGALQYCAHQARAKRGKEAHRLDGCVAPRVQMRGLFIASEQALIVAQCDEDFRRLGPLAPIRRCALTRQYATQGGGRIVDAVFAHATGGLFGQPAALFASVHQKMSNDSRSVVP